MEFLLRVWHALPMCILWGIAQASFALAYPNIYHVVTGRRDMTSFDPGLNVAFIGGIFLALIINPIYLIGVAFTIPAYRVIFWIITRKSRS